eukprot:TRINITY_DN155_c1_g2_i1.p1 TRINITY_DN155_c1_g2~~TRINITY_DN155_c1_g2_i1.p1  ORF type:complete len:1914 (+),score=500.48 TRINITY_DN155_c1_g2_i1:61-5802(+)
MLGGCSAVAALLAVATSGPTSGPHSPSRSPTAGPAGSWVAIHPPSRAPSANPSATPSRSPTGPPTAAPNRVPTAPPIAAPSRSPSVLPTAVPSRSPSVPPIAAPSGSPSAAPSATPTLAPTRGPTAAPTVQPSAAPTVRPSAAPTRPPSAAPSRSPTLQPSFGPTLGPRPVCRTDSFARGGGGVWSRSLCGCNQAVYNDACDGCRSTLSTPRAYFPSCAVCTAAEYCYGRGAPTARADRCVCENCTHGWTGEHCHRCPREYGGEDCDVCGWMYYDADPSPAVLDCQPCSAAQCNNRGSPVSSNGDVCICRCTTGAWSGDDCGDCAAQYDRGSGCDTCSSVGAPRAYYPACVTCTAAAHCFGRGDPVAIGDRCGCVNCTAGWTGDQCEVCPRDHGGENCEWCGWLYYDADVTASVDCRPCGPAQCSGRGTPASSDGARCICKCTQGQWTGDSCGVCPPQYDAASDCAECSGDGFGYPECVRCSTAVHCSNHASEAAVVTDSAGRKVGCSCNCTFQWHGPNCSECDSKYDDTCADCASGRFGYPGCVECVLSQACSGRARDIRVRADKSGCECITCLNQWTVLSDCRDCPPQYDVAANCGACASGRIRYPSCERCSVGIHCNSRAASVAANPNATECICTCSHQWTGGACEMCPERYGGGGCDQCAGGHINYPACRRCTLDGDCSGHALLVTSNNANSQCVCQCRNQWTTDPGGGGAGPDCGWCGPNHNESDDCASCRNGTAMVNFPVCTQCRTEDHCSGRGVQVVADEERKVCLCVTCRDRWTGPRCDSCPSQYDSTTCAACALGRDPHIYSTDVGHLPSGRDVLADPVMFCSNGVCQPECPCKSGSSGVECDACQPGRVGWPECELCSVEAHCSGRAVSVAVLNDSCECECGQMWSGVSCQSCPREYGGENCDVCAINHRGQYPACEVIRAEALSVIRGGLGSTVDAFEHIDRPFEVTVEVLSVKDNVTGDATRLSDPTPGAQQPELGLECECVLWDCNVSTDGGWVGAGDVGPERCTGVATATVPFFDSCKCGLLVNSSEGALPSEVATGESLALAPQPLQWFQPRQYFLRVVLRPGTDNVSDWARRQREYFDVPPLVADVPQPCCTRGCPTDNSSLALLRSKDTTCTACPTDSLVCNGSAHTSTKLGWWRARPELLSPTACPVKSHCLPSAGAPRCAFNTSGPLCGVCPPGTRITEGGCSTCPAAHVSVLQVLGTTALLVIGSMGFVRINISYSASKVWTNRLPQYVKILLTALQVLAKLSALKIQWGSVISGVFTFSSSTTVFGRIPQPLRCLLPDGLNLGESIVVWCMVPLFLGALSLLAALAMGTSSSHASVNGDREVMMWVYHDVPGMEGNDERRPPTCSSCRDFAQYQCLTCGAELFCRLCVRPCRESGGAKLTRRFRHFTRQHAKFLSTDELDQTMMGSRGADANAAGAAAKHLVRLAVPDWDPTGVHATRTRSISVGKELSQQPQAGLQRKHVFIISMLVLTNAVYIVTFDAVMAPLNCVNYIGFDGAARRVAVDDVRAACHHRLFLPWYRGVALVLVCVYGFGAPLGFWLLLRRRRGRMLHGSTITMFGFLYVNYRRERYYWESIVLLRKMLIVAAVNLPSSLYGKVFACAGTLTLCFVLHVYAQPFREDQQQRLESAAILSGICASFAALWAVDESRDRWVQWVLMLGAGLLNTSALSIILVLIALAAYHRAGAFGAVRKALNQATEVPDRVKRGMAAAGLARKEPELGSPMLAQFAVLETMSPVVRPRQRSAFGSDSGSLRPQPSPKTRVDSPEGFARSPSLAPSADFLGNTARSLVLQGDAPHTPTAEGVNPLASFPGGTPNLLLEPPTERVRHPRSLVPRDIVLPDSRRFLDAAPRVSLVGDADRRVNTPSSAQSELSFDQGTRRASSGYRVRRKPPSL